MTPHISAEPGDIAEIVLLPGDPLRAKWAAETFLDSPRLVNSVRGMLGFTGTWNGTAVTIHGSGMGMASLSIYANELIRFYGVKTLIRIGSCGAMQDSLQLGDVVCALTASSVSTPSSSLLQELNFAPSADYTLVERFVQAARSRDINMRVGGIYSSDVFYDERPDLGALLKRHGVLAVEMEAAELLTVAARHGVAAGALLTVSDHVDRAEAMSPEERERGFGAMVQIALDAATA